MATTTAIDLTAQTKPQRLFLQTVHEWLTTVDHKKLGIMYIVYALVFLLIGGLEAILMRIQLAVPHNHFVSPQVFNRLFTMHGTTMVFFMGMPILFGVGNYLVPLMIGARDMAFPRLNAFSFWITAFGGILLYFSYLGGDGLYGMGIGAGRRLVGLRSADCEGFFTWPQHRLLDVFDPAGRYRNHGHSDQYRCHRALHALQRHDVEPHAVAGVALHGRQLYGFLHDQPTDRGANHADYRPVSRRTLLRHSGGRVGRSVDALLLDIWPSRGLHPGDACLRICE